MKHNLTLSLLAVAGLSVITWPGMLVPVHATNPATDAETQIKQARFFPEPIVWLGNDRPAEADSRLLLEALHLPRTNGVQPVIEALERFVQSHPQSPWTPCLQANLGAWHSAEGRYTLALQHWEAAWLPSRNQTTGPGKRVADLVVVNWTSLLAKLGLVDKLQEVMAEAARNPVSRLHDQAVMSRNAQALQFMQAMPGTSFRCGTIALSHVLRSLSGTVEAWLRDFPSPQTGFSLFTLTGLAQDCRANLIAVQRPAGDSRIVTPCVAHYQLNHHVAVLAVDGARCRVADPAAGTTQWRSLQVVNEEASGYFLIPADQKPSGWREVSTAEAMRIVGKGQCGSEPTLWQPPCPEDGNNDTCPPPCSPGGAGPGAGPSPVWWKDSSGKGGCISCGSGSQTWGAPSRPAGISGGTGGIYPGIFGAPSFSAGMPVWEISEPYISIWLHDQPMSYQPSRGPEIAFKLHYHQHEHTWRPDATDISSLGPNWNCNWLAHLVVSNKNSADQTWADYTAWLYGPGGGGRVYQTTDQPSYHGQVLFERILENNRPVGFKEIFPGGSQTYYEVLDEVSSAPPLLRAFLTRRLDAQGNETRFYYTTNNQLYLLTHVVDVDGRTNFIRYGTNFPTRITAIEPPVGTNVVFQYHTNGMLTNLVDVAGISSSFEYDTTFSWSLNTLVTPYGRTTFADVSPTNGLMPHYFQTNDGMGNINILLDNGVGRAITVTEPDGAKHLLLYRDEPLVYSYPPNTFNDAPNIGVTGLEGLCDFNMEYRNSFYWGPSLYSTLSSTNPAALGSNDLKRARLNNWLHVQTVGGGRDGGLPGSPSDTLNMQREASPEGDVEGQKTWFAYSGKRDYLHFEGSNAMPNYIARKLPDGTSQYLHRQYNALGKPLLEASTYTKPDGSVGTRTNWLAYAANGIDLLFVTNASGVLTYRYGYDANHQLVAVTNALDEVSTYTYDANSHLTSVKHPGGLTTTNRYDANGWLTNTVDLEISRTNSFTWTNGQVYTKTDARGLTVTNRWDALRRLTNVAYPDGTTLRYFYTNLDLAQIIDRLGYTNRFTYDSVRRRVSGTDARGNTTLYSFCDCGSLYAITNALQQVTSFAYDYQGKLLLTMYPDGYMVTNTYNLAGQLTVVADTAGLSTTNWYNNQGLLVAVSNAVGRVQQAVYDLEDRVVSTTDANGVTVTNAYDLLGRLVARGYPDGGLETFGYSARGLIAHTNQLRTNVTWYAYDPAGRKTAETNANGEVTQFTYSPAGDLLTLTDGKNQTTTWKYDASGQVTNKTDAASSVIFTYRYDANGRLTNRWTLAKLNTFYAYDRAGNLTNVEYAASPDLRLAYDALNRLTNLIDAVGSTAYQYTSGGQLLSEDGPWTSDTVSYSYNNRRRSSLSVVAPNAPPWRQSYGYDAAGRLTNIVSPAGPFGYSFDVEQASSPVAISLLGSSYITNTYDALARLASTRLVDYSHQMVLNAHSYGYDLAGQRTGVTNTSGDYRLYTYDRIGQLKTARGYESNGSPRDHEKHGYAYDGAGNLNYRTNNALVHSFSLNSLNELTSVGRSGTLTVAGTTTSEATDVTVNGQSATRYADRSFSKTGYSLTDGTNTFTAIAQDSLGRWDTNVASTYLPATVTLVYDANGNLTTNGTRLLDYDDENQLIRVTEPGSWKSEFAYDGKMRRRVRTESRWQGGTWVTNALVLYVYDGMLVIQERDAMNLPRVTYTRGRDLSGTLEGAGGIGGLLARTDHSALNSQPSVAHAYYHADGNGNVTALVNTNQALVGRYWYDPYGNTLAVAGAAAQANLYRFSSKEWHESSGLVYYGYRFYSPSLQRWVNRDPIDESGGLNVYVYVGNMVPSAVDAYGLQWAPLLGSGLHGRPLVINSNGLNNMFSNAISLVGSHWWDTSTNWGKYPPGVPKCNLFADYVADQSCVPLPNKSGFLCLNPPTAWQLFTTPSWSIPGWTIITNPMPGAIISDGHHVGIVGTNNTTISVILGGPVGINNWGFRPIPSSLSNINQPPVMWAPLVQ